MLGKAPYMHFVNHRLVPWAPQGAVAAPIKAVFQRNAFGRPDDPIGRVQEITGQCLGVGVQQTGAAVEPESPFGVKRSIQLEVVERSCSIGWKEGLPQAIPTSFHRYASRGVALLNLIVEKESRRCGVTACYQELGADDSSLLSHHRCAVGKVVGLQRDQAARSRVVTGVSRCPSHCDAHPYRVEGQSIAIAKVE